jgi:phosphomethylpyrimidine synthase
MTVIVSRSGSVMAGWCLAHHPEYFRYTRFEEICQVIVADGEDRFAELSTLGELTEIARRHDVQVMTEGPGHVPLHKVVEDVSLQKEAGDEAPIHTLGPCTVDVAPGDDHITPAVGAAVSGMAGTAILWCVTPMEHRGLPDLTDVSQGMIAYEIADHAPMLPTWRKVTAGAGPGRRLVQGPLRVPVGGPVQSGHGSVNRPGILRRDPASPPADSAHFCSRCGPEFCSMRSSQDVRDQAEQKGMDRATAVESGLKEKSTKFREAGCEVHPEPSAT